MTPRRLNTTIIFEKDLALAKRRGKDTTKLRIIIDLLLYQQPLQRELSDHPLKGLP